MQTLPDKVEEVAKLLKNTVDHKDKRDLTEMLLTIRDGLNREFQEELYSFFKNTSPDTITKMENLLPNVEVEVDPHTHKKYLLFHQSEEDISLDKEFGRMAVTGIAETGKFGLNEGDRNTLKLILQDCMNIDKKPFTIDRCLKELHKHLKLFGLDNKFNVSFVPDKGKKSGMLVLSDASGKIVDLLSVPVDKDAGDKIEQEA
jgi:hypothetical protein